MKKSMTSEEVEREIERLLVDPDVQLAKAEQRIKYKRRQYMYTLRGFQKRGRELRKAGITQENLIRIINRTDNEIRDAGNPKDEHNSMLSETES